MTQETNTVSQAGPEDFVRQAEKARSGFLHDFWTLLRYNKRWWLTPIIILLLLIALIAVLGSTAAAPFIYTLF